MHYVCSICTLTGIYEQHCHVAMYQFQDLATLFGINTLQQTNVKRHNTQKVEHLAIKQSN